MLACLCGETSARELAYVASSQSDTVCVIDTESHVITAEIQVGGGLRPGLTAVHPDGKFAYVANRLTRDLAVIDTATHQVVRRVPVGPATDISFDPHRASTWVHKTHYGCRGITALSPDGASIEANFANAGPLVFHPSGSHAYDPLRRSVRVLDIPSGAVLGAIEVPGWLGQIAITPDGHWLYAVLSDHGLSDHRDAWISVIDTETRTILRNLRFKQGTGTIWMAPAGGYAYLIGEDVLWAIDVETHEPIVAIPLDGPAADVKFDPHRHRAYLATAQGVTVIDTSDHSVEDTIRIEGGVSSIALTSDGRSAFLAGPESEVVVIDLLRRAAVNEIDVTGRPRKVLLLQDESAVYVTTDLGLSVVDVSSEAVLLEHLDAEPYAIEASPDGARVYVRNAIPRTIDVIDTRLNRIVDSIPSPAEERLPQQVGEPMAVMEDGVIVATYWGRLEDLLARFDPVTGELLSTILHPRYIDPNPRGRIGDLAAMRGSSVVYATFEHTVEVGAVDLRSGELARHFSVGIEDNDAIGEIVVTPDGHWLFAGLHQDAGTLSDRLFLVPIDLDTGTKAARIPIEGVRLGGLATDTATSAVLVAHMKGSLRERALLSFVDAEDQHIVETIGIGDGTPGSVAVTRDGGLAYVALGDEVVAVDVPSRAMIRRIPIGRGPQQIAMAFVDASGSTPIPAASPTPTTVPTIAVPDEPAVFALRKNGFDDEYSLSIVHGEQQTSVDLPARPDALAVSPDGARVYIGYDLCGLFVEGPGGSISVLDAGSGDKLSEVLLQGSPFDLTFVPDGSLAYVATGGCGGLSPWKGGVEIIDLESGLVAATMPVGLVREMEASNDGRFIYARRSPAVVVIDTRTTKAVATITFDGASPAGLGGSADGEFLYIVEVGSQEVEFVSFLRVIETASFRTVRRIPLPLGDPIGLHVSSDGRYAFIRMDSCDPELVQIDLVRGSVQRRVPLPRGAGSPFAVVESLGAIYVPLDDIIKVLDLETGSAVAQIDLSQNVWNFALGCDHGCPTLPPPIVRTPPTLVPTATPTVPRTPTPTALGELREDGVVSVSPAAGPAGSVVPVSFDIYIPLSPFPFGIQFDLEFASPLYVLPFHDGTPDCSVGWNMRTHERAEFLPVGCEPSVDCTRVRVTVADVTDYHRVYGDGQGVVCNVKIPPDTRPARYAVLPTNVRVLTFSGLLSGIGLPGQIRVDDPIDDTIRPTPTPLKPRNTEFCDSTGLWSALICAEPVTLRAGSRAEMDFVYRAGYVDSVALEARFDHDAGLHIAATEAGTPDCRVNPEIDKRATAFFYLPSGCVPGESCERVGALVLAFDNLHPIPDGATLFTCQLEAEADAPPGRRVIRFDRLDAVNVSGRFSVDFVGVDGEVVILRADQSGAAPTPVIEDESGRPGTAVGGSFPPGRESSTAHGCQSRRRDSGWNLGSWLGLLILLSRRILWRRRVLRASVCVLPFAAGVPHPRDGGDALWRVSISAALRGIRVTWSRSPSISSLTHGSTSLPQSEARNVLTGIH